MKKILIDGLPLSMESAEPSTERELEYVWYVKIAALSAITSLASKEETQEQYQILLDGLSMRVRETNLSSRTYTVKTWIEGVAGRQETNHDVSSKAFDQFSDLAVIGWFKKRYFIDSSLRNEEGNIIPFEVDVFYSMDSTGAPDISPWIKVDLEVHKAFSEKIVLPFEPSSILEVVQRPKVRDFRIDKRIGEIQSNWNKPKNVILAIKRFFGEKINHTLR